MIDKHAMLCMASVAGGEPCGQPAAVFDADYRQVVCLTHATHLSEQQRGFIEDVLRTLARSLDRSPSGKAS